MWSMYQGRAYPDDIEGGIRSLSLERCHQTARARFGALYHPDLHIQLLYLDSKVPGMSSLC